MTDTVQLRRAAASDLSFLDHLQTRHSDAVGYLPLAALEESIARRRVWLALENGAPAGYLLAKWPYRGQEHVAIIYQACIEYDARRRLLGTALLQTLLNDLPPNIRQLCLWCARDLDANLFWQAMDFTPAALRAGGRHKGRVHVFWVRLLGADAGCGTAGDGQNPLSPVPSSALGVPRSQPPWVPTTTRGGLMRESRQVLTLAPGDDWQQLGPPAPLVEVKPARTTTAKKDLAAQAAAFGQIPPGMIRIVIAGQVRLIPRPPPPG